MGKWIRVVALASCPLLLGAAEASPAEIVLRIQGGSGAVDLTLEVEAVAPESALRKYSPRRLEVRSGEVVEVELPPGVVWSAAVVAAGFYAEPVTLQTEPRGDVVEIRVWATAPMTIPLEAPRGVALPEEVQARFGPPAPQDLGYPSGAVGCEIAPAARTASCALPVGGPFDLSLRAAGFAGAYYWDLSHTIEAPARLSAWRLSRGGSVIGFVQASDRDLRPEACIVKLEPVVGELQGSEETAVRLRRMTQTARVTPRGFFQWVDVPPGSYRIRAHQPGYSESVVGPVSVYERGEVELADPVVMVRPFSIEIEVFPAIDAHQKPWRVRLARGEVGSGRIEEVCHTVVSAQGLGRCEALAPGPYALLIEDSRGARFHLERLDLSGPTGVLEVQLPLLEVSGEVRMGEEPLPTELAFQADAGGAEVVVRSDDDGRYLAVLPEVKGLWTVEVGREGDYPVRVFQEVDLRPTGGLGTIVVHDFVLPDTTLEGHVVDSEGRPARAVVSARTPDAAVATPTKEDGTFVLRGFTPGLLQVRAKGREGDSEFRSVLVEEERESPEIELRLRKRRPFTAIVLAPDEVPVVGAAVHWRGLDAAGTKIDAGNISTDLQGSFDGSTDIADKSMLFYVLAPGHPLHVEVQPVPESGFTTLRLRRAAGALRFDYGALGGRPATAFDGTHPPLNLYWQGIEVPYFLASDWATLHGEPRQSGAFPDRVAALPPGQWAACWTPLGFGVTPTSIYGPPPGAQCVGGGLQPGGELALRPERYRPPERRSSEASR